VKKDLGLLVAQALVEQFGSTRVQTYRAYDGGSAAKRVTGWPDLESWVTTYAPHRVVTPAERIVLDTCILREGTLDPVALNRVAGDHPVSLADNAVIELVYWMRDSKARRRAFPDWPKIANLWGEVLDADMPVAPGGHELAALAGLRDFEPGFSPEGMRAYSREVWTYLAGATSVADLDRPHEFVLDGQRVTLDMRPPSPTLRAAGDRWLSFAARIGTLLRDAEADKKKVTESDIKAVVASGLVAAGDVRRPEKLEIRSP
jgi:hypothetical protein